MTCRYCGKTYQAYIIHDCPEQHRAMEMLAIHEQWKASTDDIATKLDRIIALLERIGTSRP